MLKQATDALLKIDQNKLGKDEMKIEIEKCISELNECKEEKRQQRTLF